VQRGLPIRLMVKYFRQTGTQWEIDPALRASVDFREHNIVRDPAPLVGCHVIFCRNLLIYFEEELKRRVLEKLAAALAPGGVLFLGGAESVLGITDRLEPVPEWRGVYRAAERTPAVPVRLAAGGRG
jgi:chemotaxis protein methyltransferase CheR